MYLLLDIGNTREKAALYTGKKVSALPQLTKETVSELPLQAVYFANVSGQERLHNVRIKLQLDHLPWRQVHTEAKVFGVTNAYQQSHMLGVDRWLVMLGAHSVYPQENVMIIDAGTAVTVDWLDEQGIHQGGWILPGLRLQQQAVVKNTVKVFSSDVFNAKPVPGKDTVNCLQNGCLAAVLGAIHLGWKLDKASRIILTGGDAVYLKSHLNSLPVTINPLLQFHGLIRYIDN